MRLQFDVSKTYAIALEGGGAKGAYEIGVWKALDEAGVKYNAVSGTSVGALNGALMAMRDFPRAIECWRNIRPSQVIDLGGMDPETFQNVLEGRLESDDWSELLPQAVDIIRNRGLDVSPLRAWVRSVVDEHKLKTSDVDLYISTVSLTDRKGLEVHVNELPENEICDMLLASAYHPSFRLEKLGGKYYADGGFVDAIPLHALVKHGYRDIIAVRLPSLGVEKRFKIPDNVNITTIRTYADLGHVLNFTAEQARRDMDIGYMDARRVLYGLSGRLYYIDRTLTERDALEWLIAHRGESAGSLRDYLETELPYTAQQLDAAGKDYYDLMLALVEQRAKRQNLPKLKVYTDKDLLKLVE